jgi:hypothetical protein
MLADMAFASESTADIDSFGYPTTYLKLLEKGGGAKGRNIDKSRRITLTISQQST